jgi:hypothetical protein
MRIRETYVNDTEGYRFGDSDWFEPWTEDRGKLFRSLQQEYGGCVSMMYRDVRRGREFTAFGVVVPARWKVITTGWVFRKRMRYEDARPYWPKDKAEYVREVWVTVEDPPAAWGWEDRQP